jgi:two-component system chemotaxis response regulator CheY
MAAKTVLLVDDQDFIRETMEASLTAVGGYKVLQAGDGMEAIELIHDAATRIGATGVDLMDPQASMGPRIDCIVSDINMQPMNGLEFVKAIRVGLTLIPRETPVIMLTGHAEKHFLAAAFALDVCGFLVKPISGALFRERIERAISTPIVPKPQADYATLIVPDINQVAVDVWSSATAPGRQRSSVQAADLAGHLHKVLPHPVSPLELRVGDRLSEDLVTDEGVVVIPAGTRMVSTLIAAVKDVSEIVTLAGKVEVIRA